MANRVFDIAILWIIKQSEPKGFGSNRAKNAYIDSLVHVCSISTDRRWRYGHLALSHRYNTYRGSNIQGFYMAIIYLLFDMHLVI